MSEQSESYAARALREGPLPQPGDDSELVGENDKKGLPENAPADQPAVDGSLPTLGAEALAVPFLLKGGADGDPGDAAPPADDSEESES